MDDETAQIEKRNWFDRRHAHRGSGHTVIRRGKRSRVLRPAKFSVEHPTLEAAMAEAARLAALHPGESFEVWSRAVPYQ